MKCKGIEDWWLFLELFAAIKLQTNFIIGQQRKITWYGLVGFNQFSELTFIFLSLKI